jgi:hypothetical protein
MLKHLCLLSSSILASNAVACGSPHPSDTGADGAAIPPIAASNSVTRADLATGIAPLVVPAGAMFVFDTDNGAMYDAGNGNLPIRVAGPGVQDGVFYRSDDQNRAFFAVQSVMLGERAILRGVGKRALILVAEGPVEIHGILDVSAGHCSVRADGLDCAGPGGGRGGLGAMIAAGCSPGHLGNAQTGIAGGSGGGGFASPGGAGGGAVLNASISVTGGAGGSGAGCPGPALDPIIGGSGGYDGNGLVLARAGGGGGGAVQITSYTSIALVSPTVASTGGVWGGGAGGSGGAPGGSGPLAGGGGGAGGAILLEAPMIDIHAGAVLAANGGGGGAGGLTVDGQPGQFSATPAPGGSGSSGCAGGPGAAKNTSAVDGASADAAVNSNAGGGGGGGMGRIRFNAIVLNVSDQAVLSPAPSTNILPSS